MDRFVFGNFAIDTYEAWSHPPYPLRRVGYYWEWRTKSGNTIFYRCTKVFATPEEAVADGKRHCLLEFEHLISELEKSE